MPRSLRALLPLMLGILLVTGCTGPAPKPDDARPGGGTPGGSYRAAAVTGDYANYPALRQFIDRMVKEQGYNREYLNGLFSEAKRKDWTLDYMKKDVPSAPSANPSPGSWSRYRAKFLDELHISKGAAYWDRYATALRQASERYGVPPEYILGIMGVETIYGANVGKDRVLDALTTLAFDFPRRSEYFTGELEGLLIMAKAEGLDPAKPRGSFAGAMGLGQFMPTSFLKWAVDFNGDGRRDLWEPVDAIGSVANYFKEHGWKRGEPVVTRATVTGSRADSMDAGFNTRYSLATLAQAGVQPVDRVPEQQEYRLLRLSGNGGLEYWLGHQNFYVITRYNNSTHYAMAVHQLAQAIKARHEGR